jgi:Xaa-Pro aminopeptidase
MSYTKLPVLRHGLMARHPHLIPDETIADRNSVVRTMMKSNNVRVLVIFSDAIHNAPGCYLTNYPCYGLGRENVTVLGLDEGPFLFTTEPLRNLPKVDRFTTCPVEKVNPASKFIADGCAKAKELAGKDGVIGLVGTSAVPSRRSSAVKKNLEGWSVADVSAEFDESISSKDSASLDCIRAALKRATMGFDTLKEKAQTGDDVARDSSQLAAYVDYVLRREGCEDINVLISVATNPSLRVGQRVGYPDGSKLHVGDTVMAFVGAQYARHWGVAAGVFKLGTMTDKEAEALRVLEGLKAAMVSEVKAGMTLAQVTAAVGSLAKKTGVTLAPDVPIVEGIGFDMDEYPSKETDKVEENAVLLVSLYSEFGEGVGTMITSGMLLCGTKGGRWL